MPPGCGCFRKGSLQMIIYIIVAVIFFGILVGIHEFGHFAVAKACGIRVEEFSIGMGPALLKKQKGETLYALRCIPFGGYCAMTGEDGESEDPRAFVNQAVWKRLLVLVAGAFMNFLLGFLIVFFLYSNATGYPVPIIASFMDGCPYESAEAFQAGDQIVRIDGHRIYSTADIGDFLREDAAQDFVIVRNGEKLTLKGLRLQKLEYTGEDGTTGKYYGFRLGYGVEEPTFLNHLHYSWNQTMEFVRLVWSSLRMLVNGEASVRDLSGPVGIIDMMAETGESAETTFDAVFDIAYLGAFIAVNLAVMNMLPIPALDGGRVFLLIVTWGIESVTRKKLNPKYEGAIHTAGMALLLALMAFIMIQDVVRIFKRG